MAVCVCVGHRAGVRESRARGVCVYTDAIDAKKRPGPNLNILAGPERTGAPLAEPVSINSLANKQTNLEVVGASCVGRPICVCAPLAHPSGALIHISNPQIPQSRVNSADCSPECA